MPPVEWPPFPGKEPLDVSPHVIGVIGGRAVQRREPGEAVPNPEARP